MSLRYCCQFVTKIGIAISFVRNCIFRNSSYPCKVFALNTRTIMFQNELFSTEKNEDNFRNQIQSKMISRRNTS